jgi:hypothetical protein
VPFLYLRIGQGLELHSVRLDVAIVLGYIRHPEATSAAREGVAIVLQLFFV